MPAALRPWKPTAGCRRCAAADPYIHEQLSDAERYQTVYAREPGSAAAPTAGLHFTPLLLDDLRATGVETAFLTLHVGPATFRPVQVDDARLHPMHAEYYQLNAATAATLAKARADHRRIVAVGTTSVRVLEQIGQEFETRHDPRDGGMDAAANPALGYRYRLVERPDCELSPAAFDAAHAPGRSDRSRADVQAAYQEAIRLNYRFYSFGDAMLIL